MSRFSRLAVASTLLVVVLWAGLWWSAENCLIGAFQQRVSWMRQDGWAVTHGPIIRGWSPLAARIEIKDLALKAPGGPGRSLAIGLPHLGILIRPFSPFTIVTKLPLLWHISTPAGIGIDLTFRSITGRYHIDPSIVFGHTNKLALSGATAASDIRINSTSSNFLLLRIASFREHFRANPVAGANGTAYRLRGGITGIAVSQFFVDLLHLPFDGSVRSLNFDLAMSGPNFTIPHPASILGQSVPMNPTILWREFAPQYKSWAVGGGHGSLALSVAIGPLQAQVNGSFRFDRDLQPVAHGHIRAVGLGAFLALIATQSQLAADLTSQLAANAAPYMFKGPGGAQQLAIDFLFRKRVLSANGAPVKTFPALPWPSGQSATTPDKSR